MIVPEVFVDFLRSQAPAVLETWVCEHPDIREIAVAGGNRGETALLNVAAFCQMEGLSIDDVCLMERDSGVPLIVHFGNLPRRLRELFRVHLPNLVFLRNISPVLAEVYGELMGDEGAQGRLMELARDGGPFYNSPEELLVELRRRRNHAEGTSDGFGIMDEHGTGEPPVQDSDGDAAAVDTAMAHAADQPGDNGVVPEVGDVVVPDGVEEPGSSASAAAATMA